MSFKREGDNVSLLNNLKRRRISEILATNIPEDEAYLMKNGRYACMVCQHRPVFDTLDMMGIHRKGKKHLANLPEFMKRQQELKDLVLKRKQIQYLQTGSATLKNTAASNVAAKVKPGTSLLKSSIYSSCCKRKKRPTDRKVVVDVDKKTSADAELKGALKHSDLATRSTDAVVKEYLKGIQHKRSFESYVEKARQLKSEPIAIQTSSDVPLPLPPNTSRPRNTERNSRTEYYLNLRREGWKKDVKGEWVRDPDAEFESDEEVPVDYSQ